MIAEWLAVLEGTALARALRAEWVEALFEAFEVRRGVAPGAQAGEPRGPISAG